jgi:hypothetical protein
MLHMSHPHGKLGRTPARGAGRKETTMNSPSRRAAHLVRRWSPAVLTLAGLTAAMIAYASAGPTIAGILLLATVCVGAFSRPVIGSTPVSEPTSPVDPAAVRRYREEHPGSTISEAVAAITRQ